MDSHFNSLVSILDNIAVLSSSEQEEVENYTAQVLEFIEQPTSIEQLISNLTSFFGTKKILVFTMLKLALSHFYDTLNKPDVNGLFHIICTYLEKENDLSNKSLFMDLLSHLVILDISYGHIDLEAIHSLTDSCFVLQLTTVFLTNKGLQLSPNEGTKAFCFGLYEIIIRDENFCEDVTSIISFLCKFYSSVSPEWWNEENISSTHDYFHILSQQAISDDLYYLFTVFIVEFSHNRPDLSPFFIEVFTDLFSNIIQNNESYSTIFLFFLQTLITIGFDIDLSLMIEPIIHSIFQTESSFDDNCIIDDISINFHEEIIFALLQSAITKEQVQIDELVQWIFSIITETGPNECLLILIMRISSLIPCLFSKEDTIIILSLFMQHIQMQLSLSNMEILGNFLLSCDSSHIDDYLESIIYPVLSDIYSGLENEHEQNIYFSALMYFSSSLRLLDRQQYVYYIENFIFQSLFKFEDPDNSILLDYSPSLQLIISDLLKYANESNEILSYFSLLLCQYFSQECISLNEISSCIIIMAHAVIYVRDESLITAILELPFSYLIQSCTQQSSAIQSLMFLFANSITVNESFCDTIFAAYDICMLCKIDMPNQCRYSTISAIILMSYIITDEEIQKLFLNEVVSLLCCQFDLGFIVEHYNLDIHDINSTDYVFVHHDVIKKLIENVANNLNFIDTNDTCTLTSCLTSWGDHELLLHEG